MNSLFGACTGNLAKINGVPKPTKPICFPACKRKTWMQNGSSSQGGPVKIFQQTFGHLLAWCFSDVIFRSLALNVNGVLVIYNAKKQKNLDSVWIVA